MIRNLIEIQLGYINTNHPDFIDVISLVKDHPENNKSKKEDPLNLSFDSEQQRIDSDEPDASSYNMFSFNKKKFDNKKGLVDQSEIMDSRLNNLNQAYEKKMESIKK